MDYIEQAKFEITAWETQKPGFLNQTADFLLAPAEKIAAKLVPNGALDAVVKAIEASLAGLASRTTRTFDIEAVQEAVSVGARNLGGKKPTLAQRLEAADEKARGSWNDHVGYAAAEGGVTGALGFAGLAADIPALFSILLRQIQQIGACYGYDAGAQREREYVLQVLRAGFATNLEAKMDFIASLKEFEQIMIKVAWKEMAEDLAANQLAKFSLLAAVRRSAKRLGIQLTERKALQMIPFVGFLVGASLNGTLANDVGKGAYMSYRRRWIAEHARGHGGTSGRNGTRLVARRTPRHAPTRKRSKAGAPKENRE